MQKHAEKMEEFVHQVDTDKELNLVRALIEAEITHDCASVATLSSQILKPTAAGVESSKGTHVTPSAASPSTRKAISSAKIDPEARCLSKSGMDWYERVFSEELQHLAATREASPCVAATEEEALRRRVKALERMPELSPRRPTVGRPSWDRDDEHPNCARCGAQFTALGRRRHHCRNCGKIFCKLCAPHANVAPIPNLGFCNPVRHCLDCLPLQEMTSGKLRSELGESELARIRRLERNAEANPSTAAIECVASSYRDAMDARPDEDDVLACLCEGLSSFLNLPRVRNFLEHSLHDDNVHRQMQLPELV